MQRSAAATRVVTPNGVIGPAVVHWDGQGIITAVDPATSAPERTLVPGFIDLQVNGHDDVDVTRADGDDWRRLDDLLLRQGVTSWCPTLVSAPLPDYAGPLARITARAARGGGPAVLGAHLEGPFLTVAGAHAPHALCDPDLDWLDALPAVVRLVTLAPERTGAITAVRRLSAAGRVVSLGHSRADAATTTAAVDAGASLVTHLFNAMPALHHRDLGLVGTALADARLSVCVVADGHHLDPALLPVVARTKERGRWLLVTDAVAWRAGGTPSMPVGLVDGAPRRADGTLAGSAARMDACLRETVSAGVPLDDAVFAASTAPADVLGALDRGRIASGARADLVVLDSRLEVSQVWIAGNLQIGLD